MKSGPQQCLLLLLILVVVMAALWMGKMQQQGLQACNQVKQE